MKEQTDTNIKLLTKEETKGVCNRTSYGSGQFRMTDDKGAILFTYS